MEIASKTDVLFSDLSSDSGSAGEIDVKLA